MKIPDLPIGAFVDKDGTLSDVGKGFFNQLISELQTNASNEGLVAPTQTAGNLATIVANQNAAGQYTCQYGTFLYDVTSNSIRVAMNNGSNAPIFKTVTVT